MRNLFGDPAFRNKAQRLVCCLFLAFLTFGLFYKDFAAFDPAEAAVTVRATGERNAASDSSEVWIASVNAGGQSLPLEELVTDGWVFTEGSLWSRGSAELRLDVPSGSELEIRFGMHNWSGIAEIQYGGKISRLDLYSEEVASDLFKAGIPLRLSAAGLIWGLPAALFSGVIAFGLFALRNRRAAYALFGGLFTAQIALSPFYRNWDSLSHMMMAAMVSLAAFHGLPLLMNGEWKRFVPTRPKRIALGSIILYTLCAFLYNQLVLPYSAFRFGLPEFCLVLSTLIIIVICVFAFLALPEKLTRRFSASPPVSSGRVKTVRRWFLFFGILMAGYAFWLAACYPANMPSDSVWIWQQAIDGGHIDDWHPALYTLLIRICSRVIPSPLIPVLAQSVAVSAIWATGANFLYKNGIPVKALAAASAVMAFSPNNGVMMGTMLKDVAYAIAMLALSVSLARLAVTRKMSVPQSVFLIAAMFFTALVRHNGLFPVIAAVLVLAAFYLRRWRRLVPVFALALVLIIKNLIYPAIDVVASDNKLALGSPLHDIGAVMYYGGKIDADTMADLTGVVPKEVWVNTYHAYTADPYAYPTEDVPVPVLRSMDTLSKGDLLKIYLKLLLTNPSIMINARLTNAGINWLVLPDADPAAFNLRFTLGVFPFETIIRVSNFETNVSTNSALTSAAYQVLNTIANHKITDALFFRSGLYAVLLILLAYSLWMRKKTGYCLVLLPFAVNFLFMFLGTNSQAYRYGYLLFLAMPFLFLFALSGSQTSAPAPVRIEPDASSFENFVLNPAKEVPDEQ